MDFVWILFAFLCGLAARYAALPPLIGYLLAGFILNYVGLQADDSLQVLSDLGITLMLFTIGLKLRMDELIKSEVWVSTLTHMGLWVVFLGLILFGLSMAGVGLLLDLDLKTMAIIAFALSFSSTVCIIKILEESGEIKTRHAHLAIGILVLQDVVAVVFMVFATGTMPSIWALLLFGLVFIRPLLGRLLNQVGHGELLPLLGFFLAVGGYELFYLVDLKGDLGALIVGVLLSHHSKSTELYKALMGFKDLFLIGFFLSIGFTALPDLNMLMIAAAIALLLPLKSLMFFSLFSSLKVRTRDAFLTSLILGNYSEFGLIVAALCVGFGWLNSDWLVILALAVSFSFMITSLLYRSAHSLYAHWKARLVWFDRNDYMDNPKLQVHSPEVLVIGMGRVGTATYNSLCSLVSERVWGMDADEEKVETLKNKGYRIFYGDGEDAELWESMNVHKIRLVLIALPYIQDIKNIREQLLRVHYSGKVAAIARYEDQMERLEETGIDKIFNFYNEVGVGFARESIALMQQSKS